MKKVFLLLLIASTTFAKEGISQTPETVVEAQLKAYNKRDIEAFLATYHDSIEVCEYSGKVTMKGKDGLRSVYGGMFKTLEVLEAKISKRITIGNKVIDQETATFTSKTPEGKLQSNSLTVVVIYEITNNLISRVTFIRN
ncbi:MAG: nuclear transport factor 2 family protein [Chloroherpetonaceae bacterium]|nr:nuclear transport factor 2 family protein [Chloroherpetonaceae bacterium]